MDLPSEHQNIDEVILSLIEEKNTLDRGFKLLISTYQERLYWQIRKMVIHHDDANDVMQNVFIKVYKGIQNYKGNSKLYTWLYRIASNESITYLNKHKKHTSYSIDDSEFGLVNTLKADQYFDGNEAELLLQKALATLPIKQKEVFLMRYEQEMTYQQMSDLLGTSIGGLKASYHHAIKKIETFLTSH